MSTTLRALTTLALERGRADAGQLFQLHDKTAAAEYVAAGLAEWVKPEPEPAAKPAEKPKEEKPPVKTKEDKSTLKTK